MSSIAEIVSDLKYSRAKLLGSIAGLSRYELIETPIYEGWTIQDVFAHVLGWDQRVLKTLPLMVKDRASEVPSVEVDEFNQQSVSAWRDKSLAEVLAELRTAHRQIVDIIATLEHKEIDMRRERHGRTITIRSYVIDVMIDHDGEHTAEIELWRKKLTENIDREAIKADLVRCRAEFLAALEGMSEADLLVKNVVGSWSVKDVVGHIIDWQRRILDAARHIHDPSLPAVPPVSDIPDEDKWNEIMAARRNANSWVDERQALAEVETEIDQFIAQLRPGDWPLRGPYPWLNDRGTLAELLWHLARHYADHVPALQQWRSRNK